MFAVSGDDCTVHGQLASTIIHTAIPAMAASLKVAPLSLKASQLLLSDLAVSIPVRGWMADRFGSRRVFSTAVGCAIFLRPVRPVMQCSEWQKSSRQPCSKHNCRFKRQVQPGLRKVSTAQALLLTQRCLMQ
jgi:hypothetical protein